MDFWHQQFRLTANPIPTQPTEHLPGTTQENEEHKAISWNVYRSDQYGFEMRYPPQWLLEEHEGPAHAAPWLKEVLFTRYQEGLPLETFRVRIYGGQIAKSIRGGVISQEPVVIGGFAGTKIVYDNSLVEVFVEKDGKTFFLSGFDRGNFDLILSSFKFTE